MVYQTFIKKLSLLMQQSIQIQNKNFEAATKVVKSLQEAEGCRFGEGDGGA